MDWLWLILITHPKFVVRNDGNVGIGTINPAYKLEVNGTGKFTGSVDISAGTSPYSKLSPQADGSLFFNTVGSYNFHTHDGASYISRFYIANNGNVGIGTTSPYAKLSVVGQVVGEYFTATSTTATSTLAGGLSVASSTFNILNYNGYVGIGTSTPSSKLALSGGNFTHTASGNPTLKGSYDTTGNSNDVYISGKYSYVADGSAGLQILDISNPASPILVGTYNTSGTAYGVYVSGKYAYVADDTSGLHVINVSNPGSPTLVGTYNTSGNATSVYISGKSCVCYRWRSRCTDN
jgi:hypothetical protein